MILSFSTKFKNGNLTHFIKKIWVGLKLVLIDDYSELQNTYYEAQYLKLGNVDQPLFDVNPKIHTIREDKHNRWHAGVLIHFTVFPRSNKMFRFAPVIPCTSTQLIDIYETGDGTEIFVDGRCLDENEAELLARNDGFADAEDMLNWFNGGIEDWKIIHWTDFKY